MYNIPVRITRTIPVVFNACMLASAKTSGMNIDSPSTKPEIPISKLLLVSAQESVLVSVAFVPRTLAIAALMVIQKNIQSLSRKASKVGRVSVE